MSFIFLTSTPMKRSIIILSLIAFTSLLQAQSDIIAQFKTEDKTEISLYFYPSTLRMMNLQHNDEFNELVKDIKKMSFLKLNKNRFDYKQFYEGVSNLQKEEDLEEYVVIDGKDQKLYLLGKDSPESTVAMAYFQNEYYAIDIAGSISLEKLPKLFEQLSQNDAGLKNDFSKIFEMVGAVNSFGNDHDRKGRIRDEIRD
jgi:hypothetical protein